MTMRSFLAFLLVAATQLGVEASAPVPTIAQESGTLSKSNPEVSTTLSYVPLVEEKKNSLVFTINIIEVKEYKGELNLNVTLHRVYCKNAKEEECAISANLVGKADDVLLFQDLSKIIEKLNKLNEVCSSLDAQQDSNTNDAQSGRRRKRTSSKTPKPTKTPVTTKPPPTNSHSTSKWNVTQTALYKVDIQISLVTKEDTPGSVKVSIKVEAKTSHGQLSSPDFPLWQLYAGMTGIYCFLAFFWLLTMACNWRDLIRLQYWIGVVIALGMFEKALFFSAFNSVRETGNDAGIVIVAELVSCVKRTLGRILVIIASTGFGIVKPRLGPVLNKILLLGSIYFILCSVYGLYDALKPGMKDPSNKKMMLLLPLVILDAGIIWWVVLSLVGTMRNLRLRKNDVKLALYRHFTVAILFFVGASALFMGWWLYATSGDDSDCPEMWGELWLRKDGFFHILFSMLLLAIMLIWRPSNNKARFAYHPLTENEEDEQQDALEAYDGMKMRPTKSKSGDDEASEKSRPSSTAADDLKWVEENLPTTAVDAALPSLLDSDEELMTTKFELSKLD
ncbi:transmembrane protein 87A-like [Oscarella lobularis]|uniref:transmembrane protein 87A-like n=1 Tax=Oscarella lobularis TaxID=121494 RepID=UPI003313FA78